MAAFSVLQRQPARRFLWPPGPALWRDLGESRLRDWHQERRTRTSEEQMDLRGNRARLNWMMTLVALALATVAAQSPLF